MQQFLFDNQYYMIRNGDFATNANTKIIYGLVSTGLCIDDYMNRNSLDCFVVLIGSTAVWSFVELMLHLSKTRNIKPMFIIYGNNKKQLPQSVGIILQGFQEGGFITTLGLYYGDRLYETYYQIQLHMLIILVVSNIYIKTNKVRSSKRQVNAKGTLACIGGITVYNMYMCYTHPEHIDRQMSMFLVMVYVCSYWTFFTWYRGFRMIEVYEPQMIEENDNTNETIKHYISYPANNWETFCVLAYDVIFEIGVAYIFFYNMCLV